MIALIWDNPLFGNNPFGWFMAACLLFAVAAAVYALLYRD